MTSFQSQAAAVTVRPWAAGDSFSVLTDLLHRAYAPLAARDMNFTATTQTEATTRQRAAEGHCFVAEIDGQIVGTVTASGPYAEAVAPWAADAPWYRDPHTAHLHQFAVEPARQGAGIGQRLIAQAEAWAREAGLRWMALDTAEPADRLRALYRRLGYEHVGGVQWQGKTYRSVILRKVLDGASPRAHFELLAHYGLWATRRLLDHLKALPEADYRRDLGLFFKSIHGSLNHLLVAEYALWFQRFTGQPTQALTLNQELESDRERLAARLLQAGAGWLPAMDRWSDERWTGVLAYRATNGADAVLPFAPTLVHVFNHGTHHRGQITAALTALGRPCPELDLVWMLLERNAR